MNVNEIKFECGCSWATNTETQNVICIKVCPKHEEGPIENLLRGARSIMIWGQTEEIKPGG